MLLLIYKFIYLATAATGITLAGLVISRNWRDKFNILYSLVNFSIFIWAFARYSALTASNSADALFWTHILYFGSIAIYVLYLHSILVLLKMSDNRKLILVFFYATSLILFLLNLSDILRGTHYIIESVSNKLFFPFFENAGPFYLLQLLNNIVIPIYALFEIFLAYSKAESKLLKEQLLSVMFGSICGMLGGGTILLLVYNINIQPFGVPFVAIQFIIITYAILKQKLFNIKVIATQVFAVTLWILIFVRVLISENSNEQVVNIFILILTMIISTLLIRSVKKEVETREEIERLVKDLTEANDRLKEVDKMKTEFLSLATHQIRSPLTAIKGYASLILDGSFGKPSESIYNAVDKIFQSSQSLVLMVEDFLNISRIEQGRMKYNYESHDLFDIVQKVAGELKPTLDSANLKFSVNTDGQPHYFSQVDIGKMQQVISNLIDNAIKYTPAPGSITISVYKNSKHHTIMIDITDTGVGIDRATIGKLFKKFTRAEDANKVNVIGTGLGLYIAKQMVEGMHGTLSVKSEGKGKGATFSIEMAEDIEAVHSHNINNFADAL